MKYKEEKRDIFTLPKEWYYAHCISADCKMGAGIAVKFNKKFKLKRSLLLLPLEARKHPTCILRNKVFNLITKNKYFNKPTYDSISASIEKMRFLCKDNNVTKLSMPKIGCGLDRLQWPKVRKIIKDIFCGDDIEILVCHL